MLSISQPVRKCHFGGYGKKVEGREKIVAFMVTFFFLFFLLLLLFLGNASSMIGLSKNNGLFCLSLLLSLTLSQCLSVSLSLSL